MPNAYTWFIVAAPPLSKEGYEHNGTVLHELEHNPSQFSRTTQKFTGNPLIHGDFGCMPATCQAEVETETTENGDVLTE